MAVDTERWTLNIVAGAGEMSEAAAYIVMDTVRAKPNAAISLPTGSTPLGMFDVLAARAARREVDFSRVEVFCLDEYVGVTPDDPNSLTGWLREAILERAGFDPGRLHMLPAAAEDPVTAALAYEHDLAACGGLDLVVLGLGPNGHIAYNEPGSTVDSRTRVLALTQESIAQASAYWHDTVPIPSRAMTMGVGTLLDAKRIVLIVTGEAKADMLRRTLEEPPSAGIPASWLRLAGSRLEIIADEAAASALTSIGINGPVASRRGGHADDGSY
jgi:glucosamine-6-phosphate deaminase